jgi:subtilisin family serine protease
LLELSAPLEHLMSVWDKLDPSLASIYANYLRFKEHGASGVGQVHRVVAGGGRLNVSLHYSGDLRPIEVIGFQTVSKHVEGLATGTVDLVNLEKLAAYPGVLKMSFGRKPKLKLDQSVPDIGANQVWTFSSGSFSGSTGTGVIVGVIDTGIDVQHPFFVQLGSVPPQPRILRIWDQGLIPQNGESSPAATLLSGGSHTYGVEYNFAQIMAGFGGLSSFRHRDCDGHGTHVASIAAGNGQDKFKYIGVAPGANLIVVKYLDLQNTPQLNGADIDEDTQFYDAVSYILNVAKTVFHQPVVINCSFGQSLGPHDGFTAQEDFLTKTFQGAVGQVLVQSAGNDAGSKQHAQIEFPAGGGSIDIPVDLTDTRTDKLESSKCQKANLTKTLTIELYYAAGGTQVAVALALPDNPATFVAGPTIGATNKSGTFGGGRSYEMSHSAESQPLTFTGRATVTRNRFQIDVTPKGFDHYLGKYILRVSAPDAVKIQLWCEQPRSDYGFFIDDSGLGHVPADVNDSFLIGENAGADNTITVAAYSAEDSGDPLAFFSSRGPLADYGSGLQQPDKPDIAAPGWQIDAANSHDARPKCKKDVTIQMNGTSMASPHVAGVVALMIEKDVNLTVAQVMSTLKTAARPPEALESKWEVGAGRLDAKSAFDQTP